jgi:hypothetical protein
MNLKEIVIEEIELHHRYVNEGLSALLHTILFVRAPNLVKPEDHQCIELAPLIFAKCGPIDVDESVKRAILNLNQLLTPVGPHLSKATIVLSFFEHRETKGFFGLISNHEKVYFERWRIPIIINELPLTRMNNNNNNNNSNNNNDSREDNEELYLLNHARDQIQNRILTIIQHVNTSIDHVPPSLYEYEIG